MVSIIIPNYNHAKYLTQRIKSVLNQSYDNIEVIILDDNSSDDSINIINQYKSNPKVRHVIINSENSGSVFRQWGRGIAVAKGEFIWIAESDDFAHPSFLEKTVAVLEIDHKIGLAYCNSYIVTDSGSIIEETFADRRNKTYQTDKWNRSYNLDGPTEIKENLILGCTVNNASAVLFRKQALAPLFPLEREFKYIGDWYCYLNICLNYKVVYVNEALNYYREHSFNASKNLSTNLRYLVEYFYLYDWAMRKLCFVEKRVMKKQFAIFTRHSGLRNWTLEKVKIYHHLFSVNPLLFGFMLKENTIQPYFDLIKRKLSFI